jgi:hypothetical protein
VNLADFSLGGRIKMAVTFNTEKNLSFDQLDFRGYFLRIENGDNTIDVSHSSSR